MAHVNHTRQLRTRLFGSLEEYMPLDMGGCSFAAFGGTPDQRADAAFQALSRYCGRCGIVVLRNASITEPMDRLEWLLHQMPSSLPDTHRVYRNTVVRSLSWSGYDLLYGLDEDSILRLMFPRADYQYYDNRNDIARQGLQVYLDIMRAQFELTPAPFGAHPYNFNLLYQLTQMSYGELDRRVLQFLPARVRESASTILNRDLVTWDVFSAVRNFAERFRRFQVLPADFGRHSRRSIYRCVCDREIISLRIPNSSEVLLNYVETELAQLADAGIPFVVLSADVDLMNCPAIQSRFLNRPAANCYMGILAESLSSVAIDNNQEKQFFSNYPQIMVFQCATEELAGPFSRNCGNYRRKEVHETRTVHRHPFQLFPTVAQGHEVQRVDECNIRPEELTSLGNGLLFMGKLYDPAIRIINLRQDRRNINGPLLPTLPPGN